uniref:Uncharacterized protein n=1 Tax=Cacopsylla melanoneura TaxID=428564 RepID=A0A8D8TJ11_9HEMI
MFKRSNRMRGYSPLGLGGHNFFSFLKDVKYPNMEYKNCVICTCRGKYPNMEYKIVFSFRNILKIAKPRSRRKCRYTPWFLSDEVYERSINWYKQNIFYPIEYHGYHV